MSQNSTKSYLGSAKRYSLICVHCEVCFSNPLFYHVCYIDWKSPKLCYFFIQYTTDSTVRRFVSYMMQLRWIKYRWPSSHTRHTLFLWDIQKIILLFGIRDNHRKKFMIMMSIFCFDWLDYTVEGDIFLNVSNFIPYLYNNSHVAKCVVKLATIISRICQIWTDLCSDK